MNDAPDPDDAGVTRRLRALGRQPVDPRVQSRHLTAMAQASVAGASTAGAFGRGRAWATKIKVGVALLAGLAIGGTGLASAGALGPLQGVGSAVVRAATPLDPPRGKAGRPKNWAGCVPVSADRPEVFAKNRGQYLKQERAKGAEALAAGQRSDCGKGLDDDADGNGDDDEGGLEGGAGAAKEGLEGDAAGDDGATTGGPKVKAPKVKAPSPNASAQAKAAAAKAKPARPVKAPKIETVTPESAAEPESAEEADDAEGGPGVTAEPAG